MSDNLGLAQLSDHLLIVAVVVYSLAMLAYAGDFAYGRRVKAAGAARARPLRWPGGGRVAEPPRRGHRKGRNSRRRPSLRRRRRIRRRATRGGWDR